MNADNALLSIRIVPKNLAGLALYQGTALAVPQVRDLQGFSPCGFAQAGAKARYTVGSAARLKPCPDTQPRLASTPVFLVQGGCQAMRGLSGFIEGHLEGFFSILLA